MYQHNPLDERNKVIVIGALIIAAILVAIGLFIVFDIRKNFKDFNKK